MLDERHLTEDRIVIIASDNGRFKRAQSSGPLKGKKGEFHEGGHRIPLVMRWDGGSVGEGKHCSNLIGLNDLFAIICHLAGAVVPSG